MTKTKYMKKLLSIGIISVVLSSFNVFSVAVASPCNPSISIMEVHSVRVYSSTDKITFKLNGLACPAGIVDVRVDGVHKMFYDNYDVAGSFVIENNDGISVTHANQHVLTVDLYDNMGGWPVFAVSDSQIVTTVPDPA